MAGLHRVEVKLLFWWRHGKLTIPNYWCCACLIFKNCGEREDGAGMETTTRKERLSLTRNLNFGG